MTGAVPVWDVASGAYGTVPLRFEKVGHKMAHKVGHHGRIEEDILGDDATHEKRQPDVVDNAAGGHRNHQGRHYVDDREQDLYNVGHDEHGGLSIVVAFFLKEFG